MYVNACWKAFIQNACVYIYIHTYIRAHKPYMLKPKLPVQSLNPKA